MILFTAFLNVCPTLRQYLFLTSWLPARCNSTHKPCISDSVLPFKSLIYVCWTVTLYVTNNASDVIIYPPGFLKTVQVSPVHVQEIWLLIIFEKLGICPYHELLPSLHIATAKLSPFRPVLSKWFHLRFHPLLPPLFLSFIPKFLWVFLSPPSLK